MNGHMSSLLLDDLEIYPMNQAQKEKQRLTMFNLQSRSGDWFTGLAFLSLVA